MDSRVKLNVVGICYTHLRQEAYALLLAQENGPYRIPVIIGEQEAQSIAIKFENIVTPRPLTHDLFIAFARAYGVALSEVFIYKFEDGVFYSQLSFTDGDRRVEIDARTSDAVALALRFRAPIYTTIDILQETGFFIENDPTVGGDALRREPAKPETRQLDDLSVDELQRLLDQCVAEEKYEDAARIDSIIKTKLNNL